MRHTRYTLLSFIVASVLTGVVVQSAVVSALAQWARPDNILLGLVSVSAAGGMAGAVICFAGLMRHERAKKFTDEVIGELLKVTWPTREETVRATTTVIFTTLFVAALLGVYDLLWKNLADMVLFTQG